MVPNEHGTWYFGRNGWCDGQDVKPVIWDVTAATNMGEVGEASEARTGSTGGGAGKGASAPPHNFLRYYALSYDVGQPNAPNDKGCGGTIDMSSYLLFYR
jgi:hypothetical protein